MARRAPPMPQAQAEPRKAVPMKLQRDLALKLCADLMRRMGMVEEAEPVSFELDHDPALVLRDVDPATGRHIPHQHDPEYLIWKTGKAHDRKTNGRGGEKRTTTYGSDKHVAAKLTRLTDAEIERHRRQMLGPSERSAVPAKPGPKMQSRPMRSTRRTAKLSPTRRPDKLAAAFGERRP